MTQTAINYGKILYDLNIPREQIQILDELLSEEPKIVAYLSNPTIEQPEKSAVVNRILDGELAAFVNMLCKYHRTKYLPDAIQAYYKYYDKQKGIVRCTLKYTKPVKQEEKEKMKAVLMAKFHAKEIIIKEHQEGVKYSEAILNKAKKYDWDEIVKNVLIAYRGFIKKD